MQPRHALAPLCEALWSFSLTAPTNVSLLPTQAATPEQGGCAKAVARTRNKLF